jgi:glutamine phosphoribosylpyrophosphate amidotransferase
MLVSFVTACTVKKDLIMITLFFCNFEGADSLAYLSVEGLKAAVLTNMKITRKDQAGHCTACLTGEYPGGVPEELDW